MNRDTKSTRITFDSVKNNHELLKYIKQQKWNIYTLDYDQEKWRNHGHILKLPTEKNTIFDGPVEEGPVKYFEHSFPSNYFSSPDAIYGELIGIRGVVFRKSDGKVYLSSCDLYGPCSPSY